MIYQPSEDSFLLATEVKKKSNGKKVLDVGSGSGILAESRVANCLVKTIKSLPLTLSRNPKSPSYQAFFSLDWRERIKRS